MRAYFVIESDADRRTAVIDGFPVGGPEKGLYGKGISLAKSYPHNATITISHNFPGRELRDFLPNTLSALIVSAKAKAVVESLGVQNVEFLPAKVLDQRGKVAGDDYAFLNLLGSVDCIDMEASSLKMYPLMPNEIFRVKKMVLDQKNISPDAKMFRCLHATEIILVRDDAREAFQKAALTGCQLTDSSTWSGF